MSFVVAQAFGRGQISANAEQFCKLQSDTFSKQFILVHNLLLDIARLGKEYIMPFEGVWEQSWNHNVRLTREISARV